MIQSFVVIQLTNDLTVHCETNLGYGECQIDLIIDGILRDTIRYRGTKSNRVKKLVFQHGIHKVSRKTWRGKLIVSDRGLYTSMRYSRNPIPKRCVANDISQTGFDSFSETKVGTIEVQIAKADGDIGYIQKVPAYFDTNRWSDLEQPFGDGSVEPDCQITYICQHSNIIHGNGSIPERTANSEPPLLSKIEDDLPACIKFTESPRASSSVPVSGVRTFLIRASLYMFQLLLSNSLLHIPRIARMVST